MFVLNSPPLPWHLHYILLRPTHMLQNSLCQWSIDHAFLQAQHIQIHPLRDPRGKRLRPQHLHLALGKVIGAHKDFPTFQPTRRGVSEERKRVGLPQEGETDGVLLSLCCSTGDDFFFIIIIDRCEGGVFCCLDFSSASSACEAAASRDRRLGGGKPVFRGVDKGIHRPAEGDGEHLQEGEGQGLIAIDEQEDAGGKTEDVGVDNGGKCDECQVFDEAAGDAFEEGAMVDGLGTAVIFGFGCCV